MRYQATFHISNTVYSSDLNYLKAEENIKEGNKADTKTGYEVGLRELYL